MIRIVCVEWAGALVQWRAIAHSILLYIYTYIHILRARCFIQPTYLTIHYIYCRLSAIYAELFATGPIRCVWETTQFRMPTGKLCHRFGLFRLLRCWQPSSYFFLCCWIFAVSMKSTWRQCPFRDHVNCPLCTILISWKFDEN